MKRLFTFLLAIVCIVGLAACQKTGASQPSAIGNPKSENTSIEMELDQNYDDADPFINARLFCVSEDIAELIASGSFQMDGESGIVEIRDNRTNEVLWSNTWSGRADTETFSISLHDLKKEKEYAVYFTGTKIKYAKIKLTFESDLVQERERPLA